MFVSIYDDNQVNALPQYGFIRNAFLRNQAVLKFWAILRKKYVQRIAIIFIYESTTEKSTLFKGCLISECISNFFSPQKICEISVHQLLNVEEQWFTTSFWGWYLKILFDIEQPLTRFQIFSFALTSPVFSSKNPLWI